VRQMRLLFRSSLKSSQNGALLDSLMVIIISGCIGGSKTVRKGVSSVDMTPVAVRRSENGRSIPDLKQSRLDQRYKSQNET